MLKDFLGALTKEALKAGIDNQTQQTLFSARLQAEAITRNPCLSYWEKQRLLLELENRLQNYLRQQEAKKLLAGCVEQTIKHL